MDRRMGLWSCHFIPAPPHNLSCFLLPKPLACERFSRTCFEVVFKFLSFAFFSESMVGNQLPGRVFGSMPRACRQLLSYRKPFFRKSLISMEKRAVRYPGVKFESASFWVPGFRTVRLAARKPAVFRARLTPGMTSWVN